MTSRVFQDSRARTIFFPVWDGASSPLRKIAAMHAWVLDKAKSLGQILLEQGHLNPQHLALLEPLVQAHIQAHHNDPQQSLAALSSVSSLRDELAAISDDQLQESLRTLGATRQARIDGICDSFEEAWRRAKSVGERPAIEDYLEELSGPQRAFLLCELAAVDLDYRRLAGESPSVAEYPRAAALAGNAFYSGALRPVEIGHLVASCP